MNHAAPAILDATDPCSPLAVPKTQTALLLLDFHNFIVGSQPNEGQDVLSKAVELRSWAKTHSIMVLHCLIDLKALTAANRKMAGRVNGVRQKWLSYKAPSDSSDGDPRGEAPQLAASADEYLFYRPPSHVSALGSYGLEEFLAQRGIRSLVLAGFSTSGCVINTAKGAADKGFVVTAVSDACGDKDKEVHTVIMEKLLVGQVHVTQTLGWASAWEARQHKDCVLRERT